MVCITKFITNSIATSKLVLPNANNVFLNGFGLFTTPIATANTITYNFPPDYSHSLTYTQAGLNLNYNAINNQHNIYLKDTKSNMYQHFSFVNYTTSGNFKHFVRNS